MRDRRSVWPAVRARARASPLGRQPARGLPRGCLLSPSRASFSRPGMSQPSETLPSGEPAAPVQPAVTPPTPESQGGLRNVLAHVVPNLFSSPSPTELYRYNYTKLPRAALIDVLPDAEKPSLRWYLEVALCALRATRNRIHWTGNEAPPSSGTVDLSHLGLGSEELSEFSPGAVTQESLDAVKPEELEAAPHAGGEVPRHRRAAPGRPGGFQRLAGPGGRRGAALRLRLCGTRWRQERQLPREPQVWLRAPGALRTPARNGAAAPEGGGHPVRAGSAQPPRLHAGR